MSKTIEQMAEEYAEKKVEENIPRSCKNNSLHVKKGQYVFCGYDVEQAYDDGANMVLDKIEFAMSLGSVSYVSLAAIRQSIEQLKGK